MTLDISRNDALSAALIAKRENASAEDIVTAAHLFWQFLSGASEPKTLTAPPNPAINEDTAPATNAPRRGRPPKDKAPAVVDEPPEEAAHRKVVEQQLAKHAKEEAKLEELEAEGVTEEQVGKAIVDLVKANQREAALELLKSFGATNKSTLKPEHYAAFHTKAQEILFDI